MDPAKKFFNPLNLLYWLALALVITIQHLTVGKLWKRQENHRWTLGYATVFGLSIPLVATGRWDLFTWAALFFGVGISGALKTGLEQTRNSAEARNIRRSYVSPPRQRRR